MRRELPPQTLSPVTVECRTFPNLCRTSSAAGAAGGERVGPSVAFSNLKRQMRGLRELLDKVVAELNVVKAERDQLKAMFGDALQGMNDGDRGK